MTNYRIDRKTLCWCAFRHPDPAFAACGERPRIWPVFLPYLGCPGRCLYCASHLQTGIDPGKIEDHYAGLDRDLAQAAQKGVRPLELGFFGATFTSLPRPWPERFLELAARYRDQGLITRVRCSTRPDAVDARSLGRYRGLGLDMVELGIQSFDPAALERCSRGYGPDLAARACREVRRAGLSLGVQLMPGLPGSGPRTLARDIETALETNPECARLYPCLVIRGSALEKTWRGGGYRPWSLARATREMATGVKKLWDGGVRVIRMGLAPQPELDGNILAGPVHPALGQMIRSRVLLDTVRAQAAKMGQKPRKLLVPQRAMGEIPGQNREMIIHYRKMGIEPENITAWDKNRFVVL